MMAADFYVNRASTVFIDRATAMRCADEADRIARVKRCGAVPVACDRDQIPVAPARGPVLVFHPRQAVVTDAGNIAVQKVGRFAALQIQDAFHKAEVQAISRKRALPFTPGQIDIGREYAELCKRCGAVGLKLSQLDGVGGGGGGGVSEAVQDDLNRHAHLQRRIGNGTAMAVRRVRPSRRGAAAGKVARNISDARLVYSFCVDGETLRGILQAHGWGYNGKRGKLLERALCAALDRMRGYFGEVVQNGG